EKGGKVAPVANAMVVAVLRTLPRRSARPGSIVTRYAVFARKPFRGRTVIRFRCQPTLGDPSRGEIRNSASRFVPTPDGRSLTTSSNLNSTLLTSALVAPESGEIDTISGGVCRSGPPGGAPADAQARLNAATALTARAVRRRTRTSPSP